MIIMMSLNCLLWTIYCFGYTTQINTPPFEGLLTHFRSLKISLTRVCNCFFYLFLPSICWRDCSLFLMYLIYWTSFHEGSRVIPSYTNCNDLKNDLAMLSIFPCCILLSYKCLVQSWQMYNPLQKSQYKSFQWWLLEEMSAKNGSFGGTNLSACIYFFLWYIHILKNFHFPSLQSMLLHDSSKDVWWHCKKMRMEKIYKYMCWSIKAANIWYLYV